MIDACRRASAGRITAVIPYFGYARQDRKAKGRDPISAKLVANMIEAAGADRVLTMDLHASQIQGFFDIPVDNLLSNPVFVKYYMSKFEHPEEMVVVSPDVGSVARSRTFANKMGMNLAIVDKRREKANQCEVMNVIGDVKGKKCILFDDMVDTAGSLCNAAKAIVEIGGATEVYACATHGVLSGPANERIANSCIKELTFLNTIPPLEGACSKIKYLDVSPPVRHLPLGHRQHPRQPVLQLRAAGDLLETGIHRHAGGDERPAAHSGTAGPSADQRPARPAVQMHPPGGALCSGKPLLCALPEPEGGPCPRRGHAHRPDRAIQRHGRCPERAQ